ncbi:MAG: ABC transporter ATP-binding protein [Desulfobaccales bacterium]|jgi:branched-chain amino acid transport system ATP-binding protein
MLLSIHNLYSYYGDIQALRGVSLEIEAGQIVTLVGPNAAGKSTTINCISGIIDQKSGQIEFLGKRIDQLPPHRIVDLGLVQVPEGRRVFPFMSVMENLDMGCYCPKARAQKKENLARVLDLLPVLKERRQQLAGSLSGGEQQMLAVGRGLMAEPKLLMLDEPTMGLAPLFVEKVFELVLSIRSQGTTVLLVEQNVHHALSIADFGYVLENGAIVLEDTGKRLLQDERLTKAYLGM